MNRANPETLAIICNSLVSLMGVRVDALINYLNDLFGVMLQLSQHQNAFVATQATGILILIILTYRILECFCHIRY